MGTAGPTRRSLLSSSQPCRGRYTRLVSVESPPGGAVELSTDLDDPSVVSYFLWDEPMTLAELKRRLDTASRAERHRLLAKILREARDTEVWSFTTPESVAQDWKALSLHLGKRRAFWEFLLESWVKQGRLKVDWAR